MLAWAAVVVTDNGINCDNVNRAKELELGNVSVSYLLTCSQREQSFSTT